MSVVFEHLKWFFISTD